MAAIITKYSNPEIPIESQKSSLLFSGRVNNSFNSDNVLRTSIIVISSSDRIFPISCFNCSLIVSIIIHFSASSPQ